VARKLKGGDRPRHGWTPPAVRAAGLFQPTRLRPFGAAFPGWTPVLLQAAADARKRRNRPGPGSTTTVGNVARVNRSAGTTPVNSLGWPVSRLGRAPAVVRNSKGPGSWAIAAQLLRANPPRPRAIGHGGGYRAGRRPKAGELPSPAQFHRDASPLRPAPPELRVGCSLTNDAQRQKPRTLTCQRDPPLPSMDCRPPSTSRVR